MKQTRLVTPLTPDQIVNLELWQEIVRIIGQLIKEHRIPETWNLYWGTEIIALRILPFCELGENSDSEVLYALYFEPTHFPIQILWQKVPQNAGYSPETFKEQNASITRRFLQHVVRQLQTVLNPNSQPVL